MSEDKKIAVIVIPTYNEAGNIETTIQKLEAVFDKVPKRYSMHILVVDDTSPDGTSEIVKKLQKKKKNLHLLLNKKKAGLGGAYLKGLAYAFDDLKADVAFEFDADGQHQPKHIPSFLKKIDVGYDLVLGSRYIPGGSIPSTWGFHRKLLSVGGNKFIQLILTNFRIHDWTTGYRAIRKQVHQRIEPILRQSKGFSGYTWQIGQLYNTMLEGFKIGEVPIEFVDRTKGESKLGLEYLKHILIFIFKIRILSFIKLVTSPKFIKFGTVGFIGFLINAITLELFRKDGLVESLAVSFSQFKDTPVLSLLANENSWSGALAAELAIISNFILNNFWTFASERITNPFRFLYKLLQFNLTSFGAVVIQFIVIGLATVLFGDTTLVRQGSLILSIGFLIIPYNWTMYHLFIWKNK